MDINLTRTKANGSLTVFLGAAAGVGKTYAMLEAARELKQQGQYIVIGWMETHGQKETEALIQGLEIIPSLVINHQNKFYSELNLDIILNQKPGIVLIDELAHTNIPGCRHNKRYQDVEEILAAGIDVYTTLNIEHLESLNDIVTQITGVNICETVPDFLLEKAEVKLIDIPTQQLIQRLNDGKVYIPDQNADDINKFYRPGNINALREMALRFAAQVIDRKMENYMRDHAIKGPWPVTERVMVCVSSSFFASRLIRVGHRMAARQKADWLVVYIEKPGNIPETGAEKDRLYENLHLAEELGANVITSISTDVAREILAIARQHNVTQIIIGKPLRSRLVDFLRGSVVDQVIRHSAGISVHVIPSKAVSDTQEKGWSPHVSPRLSIEYLPYLIVSLVIIIITILFKPLTGQLGLVNIALIYILPVLFSAAIWERRVSLLAAVLGVLAFDFFFVPPLRSITVFDLRYLLSFLIFLVVASVTGTLSARLRQQIRHAHQREAMMAGLYSVSREIGTTTELNQVFDVVIKKIAEITCGEVIILLPEEKNRQLVVKAGSTDMSSRLPENEQAVAAWVFEHCLVAGHGTETLTDAEFIYVPLKTDEGISGVLGIKPKFPEHSFWPEHKKSIEAFANLTAIAINRIKLAEQLRQAQITAESERLRTAVFNSLSHDLRTPLTSVIGSVTELLNEEDLYDKDQRQLLLENIRYGALRMHRLINNLLDMARVHSGLLQLHQEWCDIQDIIGVAVHEVELSDQCTCRVDIEPGLPLVQIDYVLIERVLVNLLDNAVKYGGTGNTIFIRAWSKSKTIQVSIEDQGPGIPPEELDKIFDSFYRLPGFKKINGTGLGLAICKSIIEAHRGRIWAANSSASGAVFTFALPMVQPGPENIPKVNSGE